MKEETSYLKGFMMTTEVGVQQFSMGAPSSSTKFLVGSLDTMLWSCIGKLYRTVTHIGQIPKN